MGSGLDRVLVEFNKTKLKGCTLYGACGLPLSKPVFMLAQNTSNVEAKRFYNVLRRALKNQYARERPILLWDQHPSHRSLDTIRIYEPSFRLWLQPKASSQFNCQETIWSQVKAHFRKALHRRTTDLAN